MRAIQLTTPGEFEPIEMPEAAAPGPGEALVSIRRIGICGTDLHAFAGRQPFFEYPRVLGHELGVEVLEVGAGVEGLAPGDRCAVEPYMNCGRCIACRRGRTNCCADLKVLGVHIDGGMRERIVIPAHKLHNSATLSLEQLALVETLAIGANAVHRAQPQPGENVLVLGAGPIGLGVVQFAMQAGARVIVLDVNESRLAFCRERLGVADTLSDPKRAVADLEALTEGDLPTIVFDATGSPASMNASFQFVAPSGKLVFVSIVQADITFPDPLLHRREITLYASRNAQSQQFPRIIRLAEQGEIDTAPWITHRTNFDLLPAEFANYTRPEYGAIKAMVEVG